MARSFRCVAVWVGLCMVAGCVSQKGPDTAEQVPDAVRRAAREKFPSAGPVEWKRKSDGNFEAEFRLHATEVAAKFNPAGKWLETESAIEPSELPRAVTEAVAKPFEGYQLVETQSVQRSDREDLIYELHLDNGRQIVKVQLSADGAILNKSAKPSGELGKRDGSGTGPLLPHTPVAHRAARLQRHETPARKEDPERRCAMPSACGRGRRSSGVCVRTSPQARR